jgi:hypothetical protein
MKRKTRNEIVGLISQEGFGRTLANPNSVSIRQISRSVRFIEKVYTVARGVKGVVRVDLGLPESWGTL